MKLATQTVHNCRGRDPPHPASSRVVNPQKATRDVEETPELPPDLAEFIDRLIVPLLVEKWKTEGHLYEDDPAYYDSESRLAEAA